MMADFLDLLVAQDSDGLASEISAMAAMVMGSSVPEGAPLHGTYRSLLLMLLMGG